MRNYLWMASSAFAVAGAGVAALDLAESHPWWSVPVFGAVALNGLIARHNYRAAHQPPAHRPDYAKIARLEIELGLVDPPKPPPSPVQVARSLYQPPVTVLPRLWCPECLVSNGDGHPHASWCSRAPRQSPRMIGKPDQRCSLCIPGRPSTRCPFNSVCQT